MLSTNGKIQIRRLQMNFKTELGYDSTVNVFEFLGLPISNRTPTAEPPASSQYLASSQAAYPNPPRTISQNNSASAARPFAPLASGIDFTTRATNSYGDEVRPTNSQDYYSSTSRRIPQTASNTSTMHTPNFTTHAITPCGGGEIRPTSSQQDYHSAPPHVTPKAANPMLLPSPDFPSPATTSRGVEARPTNSQGFYLGAPHTITQSTPSTGMLTIPDFTTLATTSYGGDEGRTTSSAPETYSSPHLSAAPLSLSQMLPPKRVLPFPVKMTPKPSTPKPDVQVASSPPRQERSAIAKTMAKKKTNPAFKTASGSAPSSEPSERPAAAGGQPPVQPIESLSLTLNEELTGSITFPTKNPPPARKTTNVRAKANPKSRKTTTKLANAPPPPPPPAAEVPAIAGPVNHASSSSKVFEGIEPTEFMARLDSWVREYQHLPAPEVGRDMAPSSLDGGLDSYAAQPREERMAILDDMICDCLKDENFIKLVEDVDQSWRRIGLGM